jgi:hypothetical protein
MHIIAITDCHFGTGNAAEVLRRGDSFTPPGTDQMYANEHAQSLINQGAACLPSDWAKVEAKTQTGYDWASAEVARLNKLRRA